MLPWIDPSTFEKLNVPLQMASIIDKPIQQFWQSKRLKQSQHRTLVDFFLSGGEILCHFNNKGLIELAIDVTDFDIEALAQAELGLIVNGRQANVFTVTLQVFDQPEQPLHFPFSFDLADDKQRYCVAALCEQPEITLCYVGHDGKQIDVLFCVLLQWPDELRAHLRRELHGEWTGGDFEEDDSFNLSNGIAASEIKQGELVQFGWSYIFDSRVMRGAMDEKELASFNIDVMEQCAELIRSCRYKGVKNGSFTMWLLQRPDVLGTTGTQRVGQILFITPYFHTFAPRAKTLLDPCESFLETVPGFVTSMGANPIWENALPVFRYEAGDFKPILIDDAFLQRAYDAQQYYLKNQGCSTEGFFSLYKQLLDERKK